MGSVSRGSVVCAAPSPRGARHRVTASRNDLLGVFSDEADHGFIASRMNGRSGERTQAPDKGVRFAPATAFFKSRTDHDLSASSQEHRVTKASPRRRRDPDRGRSCSQGGGLTNHDARSLTPTGRSRYQDRLRKLTVANRALLDRMFEIVGEAVQRFIQDRVADGHGDIGPLELEMATDEATRQPGDDPLHDVRFLLEFMNGHWEYFRSRLGRDERAYINELIGVRNKLAHDFRDPSEDYAWRSIDTAGRLLTRIDPPSAVALVRLRDELRGSREAKVEVAVEPEPSADSSDSTLVQSASRREPAGMQPAPSQIPPDSPVTQRAKEAGPIASRILELMDETAAELELATTESHAARKYSRLGGAKVWIDPAQGRLVVDLRTLSSKSPGVDAGGLRRKMAQLLLLPNLSDQPGAPLNKSLLELWPEFRRDVLEPFFAVTPTGGPASRRSGGTYRDRAKQFGVPYDATVTLEAVLDRDEWRCQMERCHYEERAIDPSISYSGTGPIPEDIGTIDHTIPLSEPGSPGHVWSNVRASHRLCNREAFTPSN
jgi:Swt1-like HEPN